MTTDTTFTTANIAADAEINADVEKHLAPAPATVPAPFTAFTATLTAMIAAQTTQVIEHELGHAKRSIEDMVQSAVDEAVSGVDFSEAIENINFDTAIEEAVSNYDFSDAATSAVEDAAKELDLDDAISDAIGNGDFSDTISDAVKSEMKNIRREVDSEIEDVGVKATEAQEKAEEVEETTDALTARVAELEAKLNAVAPLLAAFQAAMNAMVAQRTDDALARLGVPQTAPAPLPEPAVPGPLTATANRMEALVDRLISPAPAFARIQAEADAKIAATQVEHANEETLRLEEEQERARLTAENEKAIAAITSAAL